MKMKQFVARILTAVMVLASVSFPGNDSATVKVYADEAAGSTAAGSKAAENSNIAQNKTVKASSRKVPDDTGVNAAGNAVDGNDATAWTSGDITGSGGSDSAWLQIDLGANAADYPAEAISVKFNGTAWPTAYSVKTSYTAITSNADSWWIVQERETDDYTDADGSKTDTFNRNKNGEKMVLRRYVRFEFQGLNPDAEDGVTGVSVAEITINGSEPVVIPVPNVTLQAPVKDAYPSIAEVAADARVHHTDLADRTDPKASFMRQDGTDVNWKDVERQIGSTNTTTVTAPLWDYTEDMAAGELKEGEFFAKDGVLGFNAQVHTPGTVNKFDVWKEDIVVASFQLYINQFPVAASGGNTERHLFAKGNKYRCVLNGRSINASMNLQSGAWIETVYQLQDTDLKRWMDVLMVIDGHGYMRLYVDGKPAATNNQVNGNAFLHSGEPANGFKPFSLCYSEAGDRENGNSKGAILKEKSFLKKEEGYLARFKFYTDKDNNGLLNGAGTDISDSQKLSAKFVENLNIATLEGTHGNNTGKVITNMLQSEKPTARITLCPYSRSTVWQKYENNAWTDLGVGEKFGENTVKYRAITRLIADDGFLFDEECRKNLAGNVNTENAQTKVTLTNKKRELEITSYYNCDPKDSVIEDNECEIHELILGESEVDEDYEASAIRCIAKADGTWDDVEIQTPSAEFSTCADHSTAEVVYSYQLTEEETEGSNQNEYLKLEVDPDTGKATIKPKKSSKLTMGYAPLDIQVTATLKQGDEIVTKTVNGVETAVQKTASIRVKIDDKEKTDPTTIVYAPRITITSPKTNTYPRVAEVAITSQAAHYEDIADRTRPAASLVQLTEDTRKQYLEDMLAKNKISSMPEAADLDEIPEPTITNKDSVFGFNAQGQTPGVVNKFDVVGRDVKVISFKLWLEKWPETKTGTPMVSLFGKGNQYAVQIDRSRKSIKMFMEPAAGGAWPEEEYQPSDPDGFLGKWHTIFMVVDGKGKQRLYVDGNKSRTSKQADAYAKDPDDKQPFTLGYNFEDGDGGSQKNWWRQTFAAEYGYFADFEFYTNKDYNGMINGEGTDISRAEILSSDIAEKINITELEKNSPNDLDAVITNLLQTSNPTVNITVNPYTAKTVWQQIDGNQVSEPEPTEPFKAASTYISTTTITAHDGFVFDENIKNLVKEQFVTLPAAGETEADTPEVSVRLSEKDGVNNKVLTVVATYGETDDLPCDCTITDFVLPADQTSVDIMMEEGRDNTVVLTDLSTVDMTNAITMQCPRKEHADAEYEYTFSYAEDPSSEDGVIEFTPATRTVKALKAGTAKIRVTVEAKLKGVPDDEQLSGVTKTAVITIHVDKKAGSGEKESLQGVIDDANTENPDYTSVYYVDDAWSNLQDAIREAEDLLDDGNATSAQITEAKDKISAAIEALKNPNAKTELGKAKDSADEALAAAEALYRTENKDAAGNAVYTEESWKAFTDAYEALKKLTPEELAQQTAERLNGLTEALKKASAEESGGLVKVSKGIGDDSSKLQLGAEIKGTDGVTYKVTDNVKNEVTVKKGTDTAKVKITATVVLNKVTCKIVGIEKDAFKGFKKLKNVQIGDNVTFIGTTAFSGCIRLKTVTLGQGIRTIDKKAFFNCKKLKKVVLKAKTAPSIRKAAFKKTASKVTVQAKGLKGKKKKAFLKKLRKPGGISKKSVVK